MTNSNNNSKYAANVSAIKAAVFATMILILIKAFGFKVTGSLSLKASLLDSVTDIIASLMNLLAIKHAFRPPDETHTFGHGKAEAISGIGQSIFIIVSAFAIIIDSAKRISSPEPINQGFVGIAIMVASTVITFALVIFQRRIISKTKSIILRADSLHYQTDLFTNIAVITSIVISIYYQFLIIDAIIGGFIAIYILSTSWSIIKDSFNILMDRELDPLTIKRIREIIMSNNNVLGIHDLRTRSSGSKYFIQFHMELDPKTGFVEAHSIAHDVERALISEFELAEVFIHQDPAKPKS